MTFWLKNIWSECNAIKGAGLTPLNISILSLQTVTVQAMALPAVLIKLNKSIPVGGTPFWVLGYGSPSLSLQSLASLLSLLSRAISADGVFRKRLSLHQEQG